jgi:hypothetical protein
MKQSPPQAMVISDYGSKLLSFGKQPTALAKQSDKVKKAVKLSGFTTAREYSGEQITERLHA